MILVTGAASGIGFATAKRFAQEGGTVVATDIDYKGLQREFSDLVDGGLSIDTQEQDVTDMEMWNRMVRDIVERHDRLDVLFNNAGGGHFALIENTTLEQWRYVNKLNLDSVFFWNAGGNRGDEGGRPPLR